MKCRTMSIFCGIFRAGHFGKRRGLGSPARTSSFDTIGKRPVVSVTRWKITTPQRLLELVGGSIEAGSSVAYARAAEIRVLGLRVVSKPLDTDPGHAEIQSDRTSLDDHACRKRLAMLFQFVPLDLPSSPPG